MSEDATEHAMTLAELQARRRGEPAMWPPRPEVAAAPAPVAAEPEQLTGRAALKAFAAATVDGMTDEQVAANLANLAPPRDTPETAPATPPMDPAPTVSTDPPAA